MSYVTHIYCENDSGLPGNGLYYANGELRVGDKDTGRLVNICTHLDSEDDTGIIALSDKGLNFGDVFWPWFGAEAFINIGDNKWAFGSPKRPSQSYTFGNGIPANGRYLCMKIKMEGAINTVKYSLEIKDLMNDPLPTGWLDQNWTDAVKAWRQKANKGAVPSAPDHFYTTDPKGELAPALGYNSEGITGYAYTSPQPGTVPIYRFYNATVRDHFYTQDVNGEIGPQNGYVKDGVPIGWYMYPSQSSDNRLVPLYRWFSLAANDHFYTTDPSGELAPSLGYKAEGITGYLYPASGPRDPNAVAVYRWFFP